MGMGMQREHAAAEWGLESSRQLAAKLSRAGWQETENRKSRKQKAESRKQKAESTNRQQRAGRKRRREVEAEARLGKCMCIVHCALCIGIVRALCIGMLVCKWKCKCIWECKFKLGFAREESDCGV